MGIFEHLATAPGDQASSAKTQMQKQFATTDERMKFQRKRGQVRDMIVKEGLKALGPYTGAYEDELRAQPPENYAKFVEGKLVSHGFKPNEVVNRLKPLSDAVRLYREVDAEPEAKRIASELATKDIDTLEAKLKGMPTPVTKAEEESQAATKGEIGTQLAAKRPQVMFEEQPPLPSAPGDNPYDKALEGAGVDNNTLMDSIGQVQESLNIDLDKPVDPYSAIERVLRSGFDDDLVMQFEEQARRLNPQPEAGPLASKGMTGEPGKPQQVSEGDMLRQQERQAYSALMESKELQSWYGVLAYLVLSLAVGPQVSLIVMTKAWKQGALQRKLDEIKMQYAEYKEKAEYQREWRDKLRIMAINNALESDRMKQQFEQRMALSFNRFMQAQEGAKGKVDDGTMEALRKQSSEHRAQARMAQSDVERLSMMGDTDSPEAQQAQQMYEYHLQEADKITQILHGRTLGEE